MFKDPLFIKELEKEYVLISVDELNFKYNSVHCNNDEIDIIYPNGDTKWLNMHMNEDDFYKAVDAAEKEGCYFGILRSNIR